MAKAKKQKRRPGVLVRLYPSDLALLSRICADQCTPRENYCRRAILNQVKLDQEK